MKMRGLPRLCSVLVLGFSIAMLLCVTPAHGQDAITNLDQITAAFEQPRLDCPLAMPHEPGEFQPMDIWFLDFTTLTNAVAALTNYTAEIQNGASAWRLRLIQDAESGEVVLKPSGVDVELLRIDAPPSFVAFQTYNRVLRDFCELFLARNPSSFEDLIADGCTFLDPPRVVIDVWAISAADEEAYCAYGASLTPSGMFRAMASDEDEGGDIGTDLSGGNPCSFTNLTQLFFITDIHQDTNRYTTITWPSCPIFRYIVLAADEPDTNTTWLAQAYTSYLWGQTNATSWTDASTADTNVTARFYKVERMLASPIAAGRDHSLALRPDGTLWASGDNGSGQLGDGTVLTRTIPVPISVAPCGGGISNVSAVAAGYDFSVAADTNGTVWTWGDGGDGQLGNEQTRFRTRRLQLPGSAI
jgi:hypothetical protein